MNSTTVNTATVNITIEKNKNVSMRIRQIETFFIISMGIMLATTYGAFQIFTGYEGIIIGVILFIVATPCYLIAKNTNLSYWIVMIINSIACGGVISGYFLVDKKPFDLTTILAAAVSCIVMLVSIEIFYRFESHPLAAFLMSFILNVALIIGCVAFWNRISCSFCQYGFFLLIQICSYLFILYFSDVEHRDMKQVLALGSFGVFWIVLIAVVTIISEGETLDFLDFGFDLIPTKKNKI